MLTDKNINIPFYLKFWLGITGLLAFFFVLYIAQAILVPVIYSVIFAIVISPVVSFLHRKGLNRTLSILITLVTLVFLLIGLIGILSSQFIHFIESLPIILDKFGKLFDQSTSWISEYFHINPKKINEWILLKKNEFLMSSGNGIGKTIVSTGNSLVVMVLIPVYVFMFLYYQSLLIDFIHRLFQSNKQEKVTKLLSSIKVIIQSYLIGLLFEALIVAVLNTTSLLIIGIEYAVLLGIVGALLNFIPYIGGLIAASLSIVVTLATTSSVSTCLIVVASYLLVQFIDNNFILPKLVASKVKINALASIVVVLVGGAFWGVAGMFLSIPLIAIVKVIFDQVESLKPWGFLLGDTMPSILNLKTSKKS